MEKVGSTDGVSADFCLPSLPVYLSGPIRSLFDPRSDPVEDMTTRQEEADTVYSLLLLMESLLLGFHPWEPVAQLAPGSFVLLMVAVGAVVALYFLRGTGLCSGDLVTVTARAMRRRSARMPVVTLCAPDAAGRPRPRAPGVALSAAR